MKSVSIVKLRQKILATSSSLLLVCAMSLASAPGAVADSAPAEPDNPATPTSVTADALPTVQINGVVWSQVIIGDVVYAGGSFTSARPAGVPLGTQETPRHNILAYDIHTGTLISSFAPAFNAQILSLAASPDGTRLYVGGDFTEMNGQSAVRMVAINPEDGSRLENFDPQPSNTVRAIVATDSEVYLGGSFFRLGSAWRKQVAAVRASDAAVLTMRPVVTGGKVDSLALSPDGSKLAIGGQFTEVNATNTYANGLAVINTSTSEKYSYPAADYIRNGGSSGSITSIASDEDSFYASGFTFGRSATLEGVVAVNWNDLGTRWLEDCHGDTYSVHSSGNSLYIAGHPHYCGNIGGFAQEPVWDHYRAMNFSKEVSGRIDRDIHGYTNYEGLPHPQLQNWFPSLSVGTYTGQDQGPWNVTGNDDYIVYGGEFLRANYQGQQGLVRFAKRDQAPNMRGPMPFGEDFRIHSSSTAAGEVRLQWQAAEDMDNSTLTYKVIRDGDIANPVKTMTADSTFWNRPGMSFVENDLAPGSTHTYRVFVTDPTSREARSATTSVTVATVSAPSSKYGQVVKADKPVNYWPISDADENGLIDAIHSDDPKFSGGAAINGSNAIVDGDGESLRLGNGAVQDSTRRIRPQEFSTELWFKASATQRGRLIGYGNGTTGNSTDHDRLTYLNTLGRLSFGVTERGTKRVITSSRSYTDNKWHHVVSSLGENGMRLFVDGEEVATRPSTISGLELDGFWRLGQDRVNGWSSAPTSGFAGYLDEVAIYDKPPTASTIMNHYRAGLGHAANVSPQADYEYTANGFDLSVDAAKSTDPDGTISSYNWDFGDGSTSAGINAEHSYEQPGNYQVKLEVTDSDGATDQQTQSIQITAPEPPNQAPQAGFAIGVAGLSVELDGSQSSDPDDDPLTYQWTFGDNSAPTTGETSSHAYTQRGTYDITLTVTDPDGLSDSKTQSVDVEQPAGPLAADNFNRSVTGDWGTADIGGIWTRTTNAASAEVADGVGKLIAANPGSGPRVYLPDTGSESVVATTEMAMEKMPTGGGTYLYFSPRYISANNQYYLKIQLLSDGGARTQLARVAEGTESILATDYQPNFGYEAGQSLTAQVAVIGTNPTQLAGKIWATDNTEPSTWQVTASDASVQLQTSAGIGLRMYLSGSSTNAPNIAMFDNLEVLAQ
ncbi:PKD domain-containing protein [Glutamicibacter ardleyensis]|uniref:PKD domain-containing protein n=1 Tax=Glutamicibacter ardleyensis TaxID=225894 RepID=UPI003FB6CE05